MEIESAADLAALLADPRASLMGVCLQDIDLTDAADLAARLAVVDVAGLVVLGGRIPAAVLADLAHRGAMVLPIVPGVPFDPYRGRLYRPAELYAGLPNGYPVTPDAQTYRWFAGRRSAPDVVGAVYSAIHDASITDALDELLVADRRPLVAVMGGHGSRRGGRDYAAAAELGSRLARCGALVATGGGPGTMEAVNLGAAFGGRDRDTLPAALDRLASVESFEDVGEWAGLALQIAGEAGFDRDAAVCSIGIPTWFYGHEPPNVFADRIAKYFSNALREDVLLDRATGGVIVLPGAAGTVQEIFQAATRSYYATGASPAPIVLVGTEYWQRTLAAWPLLAQLGADRPMADRILLCDTATDAVRALADLGVSPLSR